MTEEQIAKKTKDWRWLTNLWALITMGLFAAEFFKGERFALAATATAVIYIAVLSIFVTSKEFGRWRVGYLEKHFGECFVYLWSGLMFLFIILMFWRADYQMPREFIPTYIAVMGIFALTQQSKNLYQSKNH